MIVGICVYVLCFLSRGGVGEEEKSRDGCACMFISLSLFSLGARPFDQSADRLALVHTHFGRNGPRTSASSFSTRPREGNGCHTRGWRSITWRYVYWSSGLQFCLNLCGPKGENRLNLRPCPIPPPPDTHTHTHTPKKETSPPTTHSTTGSLPPPPHPGRAEQGAGRRDRRGRRSRRRRRAAEPVTRPRPAAEGVTAVGKVTCAYF